MDAILNYRSEDTEDYYTLLGCDELSSVEQILAEFKVRALEYHPDKHPENSKAASCCSYNKKQTRILSMTSEVLDDPALVYTASASLIVLPLALCPPHWHPLLSLNHHAASCLGVFIYTVLLARSLPSLTTTTGKVETFQKLQKAKEILTNEESRARYDHWRRSQMSMPFQQWEALSDSVKTSMHWAVRSKKDLMLEESDQTRTSKTENEEGNEQGETKKEELDSTTEKMEQKESESLEKSFSPQNPESPTLSHGNRWHLRFRWSGDAPSELLRKFRNYEI
uniref:DnaJ heat shock protein family (Hsp40) member C12 n=1 Tax=Equus caballus TaxID=9796 RepID=A0A5F5PKD3_HORSE